MPPSRETNKRNQLLKIHPIHPVAEKYFEQEKIYRTSGSAAFDVVAAFHSVDRCDLSAETVYKVPLGFRMEVPSGYVALMTPRSGLAFHGLTLWNAPGVVDSDYRGEVSALLYVYPRCPLMEHFEGIGWRWRLMSGTRIAQIMLVKYERLEIELTDQLSKTERGDGGFGSTGV